MIHYRRSSIRLRAAVWVITVVGLGGSLLSAGEPIAVFVRDGRILTGEVDAKTTESELWLHSAEPSILILSSIPWADISSAKVADRMFTAAELRQRVETLKAPLPVHVFRSPKPVASKPSPLIAPVVQAIEVVPELANWKGRGVPDGLEIRLRPRDAARNSVTAEGMVTVRLLGRRLGTSDRLESRASFGFWTDGGSVREYTSRLNTARYVELGRWSERLTKKMAADTGYVLQLPFRNVNPEHDLDVALDGIVEVRLSVDGQGIHEANAPLQLRTFSPLREELQLYRGTRFFPDEH